MDNTSQTAIEYDITKIDQKDLEEILKNSNISSTIIIPPPVTNESYTSYSINYIGYEDLGNHWLLANSEIKKKIQEGNKDNIIFINYANDYLVLVNIKKNLFDDGSYKKTYNPLTLSTITSMPE